MAEDAKECWSLSTLEELEQAVYISEQRFPTLNDGSRLKQFADFYMALGDETRLRIVGVLQVRDSCMCELVDALKIPASTMRHHLKILERGGLVQIRKEGKFTVYSLQNVKIQGIQPFEE